MKPFLAAVFLAIFPALAFAGDGLLLVVVKSDHSLSMVDPATLKVVARVPIVEDPHEVIASPDGRFAYISHSGGGSDNRISVVDLAARKALPPIVLGALKGPHGLAFAEGKLWFTAETAKAIGRYDPIANQVDWILGTGQDRTHMIFVAPDARSIVAANITSATMTIFDKAAADWKETVVPVGKGAEGFDVSPDGKEIWVANAKDGTLSIIGAAAKRVLETVAANVPEGNRVKFTVDGKLVFVSMLRSPEVVVFDAATRREVKRISLAHGATAIQMQPDGGRAFISSTPDDFVSVIDLKSLTETGRIVTGKQPDGLAWAGQNQPVHVLASNGIRAVMEALEPHLKSALSRPLKIDFDTSGALKQRVSSGEPFDLLILTSDALDDLAKDGKVAASSVETIARSAIGVGIPSGSLKPDLRTAAGLKTALEAAKSITFSKTGASRMYIDQVFAGLGITAQVEPKFVFPKGSETASSLVADHQADLVITLISEILPTAGVQLAGPLPEEFQNYVSFRVGVGAHAADPESAKILKEQLKRPAAEAVYKSKGLEAR